MAKAKFLPPFPPLPCRGSCLKPCNSTKDCLIAVPTTSKDTEINNSQGEAVEFPDDDFPEIESESDRELSFSFFANNASTENNANTQDGVKTEERPKEVAPVKGKKMRRHSWSSFGSSTEGVLLSLHVPVPFPGSHTNTMPHSGHETPCTTLAELEKREMEFDKLGCWSALLCQGRDQTRQTKDDSSF